MIAIQQKQEFRVIIVVPFHADGPLHSEMVRSLAPPVSSDHCTRVCSFEFVADYTCCR